MNPIAWIATVWPKLMQPRLAAEYGEFGKLNHVLADITLRGRVFVAGKRTPGDVFGDGIIEGRRQLAQELLALARAEPGRLWATLEQLNRHQGETHGRSNNEHR